MININEHIDNKSAGKHFIAYPEITKDKTSITISKEDVIEASLKVNPHKSYLMRTSYRHVLVTQRTGT